MSPADGDAPSATPAGPPHAAGLSLWLAAFFLTVGVYLPYFPLYLESIGLDADTIGLVLATPLVVRIVCLPFVGALADRFRDPAAALRLYSGLSLALFALMLLGRGPWTIMALLGLASIFWTALLPVGDAVTIHTARAIGVAYGRIRLWGSVAFIAANFGAGLVLDVTGQSAVLPLLIAAFGLTFLASLPLRVPARDMPGLDVGTTTWRALLKPALVAMVVVAGLVQASHALLYGFGSIQWQARGWSPGLIGALWATGVVAEVALFRYAAPVIARTGPAVLVTLGAGAATLRWLVMLAEPGIAVTFALQALHGLTYGATHLGLVHYIGENVAPSRAATAQSSAATVMALFMAVTTVASGPLYAAFGAGAFVPMAATSGVALILFTLWRRGH